jgi:acyl carrier protein
MALTEAMIIQHLSDTADLDGEIDRDTALFSSGALDSVAMLNLIMFVEDHAGIEIRADEVTLENFDSTACIARFAMARAA